MHKSVADIVVLIGVFAPSVCLKMKAAKAKRRFIINSGQHTFTRVGAIFTAKCGGLKINSVAVEQRIKLVEGECRRSSGADQK